MCAFGGGTLIFLWFSKAHRGSTGRPLGYSGPSFKVPTRPAIIQDVKDIHAAGLATMAYYYFDFRDVKKQDCYGLLSSHSW